MFRYKFSISSLWNNVYETMVSGSRDSDDVNETNEMDGEDEIGETNGIDKASETNENINPKVDSRSHNLKPIILISKLDVKKRKKREKIDDETFRDAEVFLRGWTGNVFNNKKIFCK